VFEAKYLFSAGAGQSRMQISGPVGSDFAANQQRLPYQPEEVRSVLKLEVQGIAISPSLKQYANMLQPR
jgi:hypothetical protein